MKKYLTVLLLGIFMVTYGQNEPFTTRVENPQSYSLSERNMADILFEQLESPSGSGYVSTYASEGVIYQKVADNFTVPSGETWRIDSIYVYAHIGALPAYLDIFIYEPGPTLPGDEVSMQRVTDFDILGGDNYLLKIYLDPGIIIPEGEYWLSIIGSPPPLFTFSWVINNEQFDGTAIKSGTNPWNSNSSDLCFNLYGSRDPFHSIPLSGWALSIGIFLIVAFTVIRLRRS